MPFEQRRGRRIEQNDVAALWQRVQGQPVALWGNRLRTQTGSWYGMLLAHAGVGVFVIGVTLVAFITVSVAVIILRVREPDLPRGFRVPGYPVTPVLSVLACLYILSGLHWYTWVAFGLWVSVVLMFYFTWGRHHSALNHTALNDRNAS